MMAYIIAGLRKDGVTVYYCYDYRKLKDWTWFPSITMNGGLYSTYEIANDAIRRIVSKGDKYPDIVCIWIEKLVTFSFEDFKTPLH